MKQMSVSCTTTRGDVQMWSMNQDQHKTYVFQRIRTLRTRRHLKGHRFTQHPDVQISSAEQSCPPEMVHLLGLGMHVVSNLELSATTMKWLSVGNFQPDCLGSSPLPLITFVALDKSFSFSFFTYKTVMIIQTHNILFVILTYKISDSQKYL